jgi:hypothetical protein
VIVRNSLLRADVAEHVQLLLVFSAHAFFLSVRSVETREFSGSICVFPQPAKQSCLAEAGMVLLFLRKCRPVRSSIGLAIILLGAPFFFYWRRRATAVLEKPAMSAGAVAVDP